jgi:uncharacterized protein (DUF433 family)
MGEMQHLAAYQLVAVGRDVVWQATEHTAVDLTRQPGQQVIADMADVLAAFRGSGDRHVVPLLRPTPGLAVDPHVRGGFPVIEGTRVPYDLVAALLDDGLDPAEVRRFYPSVEPVAARGALEFARYVDRFRGPTAA